MTDPVDTFAAFAHAAVAAYGLDPQTPVTQLNVSENGTFRIDHPGRPEGDCSVLRVHRTNYHSQAAIESELAWISALRDEGVVRTPAYLPNVEGEAVTTSRVGDDTRHVVRFAWANGHEPDESRLVKDFAELGAITARLHRHAKHWQRPPGFTRFVWDYDTSLGERGLWGRWQDGLGMGREQLEVLGRLDGVLKQRRADYGKSPERFGLIHADTRLANLLVDGDDVTVIDFDDCGLSWFMYDVASAVSFIEHEPYIPDLIDAWVQGYRTEEPLPEADAAAIPTFVMLRRLLLVAWIGSHAETETAQELGPEFTDVSCDLAETYLSQG